MQTTHTSSTLREVIGLFDTVSGLPVVENRHLLGVITRKVGAATVKMLVINMPSSICQADCVQDVLRAQKNQVSLQETVGQHMTSPAITVHEHAHIAEAVSLMVAKKIHRLCVVNSAGDSLVG